MPSFRPFPPGFCLPKIPCDIEIAQAVRPRLAAEIAREMGVGEEELEIHGHFKAKG
jgi:hypothetical protein